MALLVASFFNCGLSLTVVLASFMLNIMTYLCHKFNLKTNFNYRYIAGLIPVVYNARTLHIMEKVVIKQRSEVF